MWKDFLFLLVIIFLGYLSYRVFFNPIKKVLQKLKLEKFQSQYIFDSSPRTLDSLEYQFANNYLPDKILKKLTHLKFFNY